jgi:hypothetical protein
VSQLDSAKTNLPFHWYAVKWCKNTKGEDGHGSSFGFIENSVLDGQALIESPFSYKFGTHKSGIIPCEKSFNQDEINQWSFFM